MIGFQDLLKNVQTHISEEYAAALTGSKDERQIKAYIEKYVLDQQSVVEGMEQDELVNKLYNEMAEYSILTPYLGSPNLEEINIYGWDDIALTYTDGRIVKLPERFGSPQHAVDIVKRLLHNSGMIIDNATPIAQGHLPNNSRIAAMKKPVVDGDRGISASIRLLHSQKVDRNMIITSQSATRKMMDFLSLCLNYGASTLVAGSTSSGKTTLLNSLLTDIPDNKRIFTIESGSRELSLVRRKNGIITNNVVHTLSRPSENPEHNITQENLVVYSLRYDPDIIIIGEIRDLEAYNAVEASLTGHTVASTVHASGCKEVHTRIALLSQKKFPIAYETSMMQAAQAFPIIVFALKLANNQRKVMQICECEITDDGRRVYHSLFRYHILKNQIKNGKTIIEERFEQPEIMSDSLKNRLIQYGAPPQLLDKFIVKGA